MAYDPKKTRAKQKDVEAVLAIICKNNGENFETYKENNQILTDCY